MKSKLGLAARAQEESAGTPVWGLTSREAAILIAILVATVVIYLPSLRNGWVADDWKALVDNKLIHGCVLQDGVALDPGDAHMHLTLAKQYQKMGRELDFEREFQKFNELSQAMVQRHRAAENSDVSQPTGAP